MIFEESQAFRRPWLVAALTIPAVAVWWMFVEQVVLRDPVGSDPAPDWVLVLVWLVAGVAVPWLFYWMRLVTTVGDGRLDVRFVPRIGGASISLADVESVAVQAYRPIRQYGGWGIRWGGPRRWAFTVSGDRGVAVVLADGRSYLIGSQRPDELVGAISAEIRRVR